jgi:hypothetical protein
MVSFQTKNPNLGYVILEGLGLKNVDIFYGHLEFFTYAWDVE